VTFAVGPTAAIWAQTRVGSSSLLQDGTRHEVQPDIVADVFVLLKVLAASDSLWSPVIHRAAAVFEHR